MDGEPCARVVAVALRHADRKLLAGSNSPSSVSIHARLNTLYQCSSELEILQERIFDQGWAMDVSIPNLLDRRKPLCHNVAVAVHGIAINYGDQVS